jgi:hypothetical protein
LWGKNVQWFRYISPQKGPKITLHYKKSDLHFFLYIWQVPKVEVYRKYLESMPKSLKKHAFSTIFSRFWKMREKCAKCFIFETFLLLTYWYHWFIEIFERLHYKRFFISLNKSFNHKKYTFYDLTYWFCYYVLSNKNINQCDLIFPKCDEKFR